MKHCFLKKVFDNKGNPTFLKRNRVFQASMWTKECDCWFDNHSTYNIGEGFEYPDNLLKLFLCTYVHCFSLTGTQVLHISIRSSYCQCFRHQYGQRSAIVISDSFREKKRKKWMRRIFTHPRTTCRKTTCPHHRCCVRPTTHTTRFHTRKNCTTWKSCCTAEQNGCTAEQTIFTHSNQKEHKESNSNRTTFVKYGSHSVLLQWHW